MGFFREFHKRSRFAKSLNATFLVLVPEKGAVEDMKDFGRSALWADSISCWPRCWLIELKKVMGKVISES